MDPKIPESRPFLSKKLLIIGVICLAVVLIGIGGFLKLSQFLTRDTNSTKEDYNPLLATVGTKDIYLADVKAEALKQYDASSITNDVLKTFENTLIEHAILDNQAQKANLTASPQEIQDAIKQAIPNTTDTTSPALQETYKYIVLKNKIMTTQAESRQAYTIGYWIPPIGWGKRVQNKAQYAAIDASGRKELAEIETLLKHNKTPYEATKAVYPKYPLLKQILSINGVYFRTISDASMVATPKVFTKNAIPSQVAQTHTVQDALFSLPVNTIQQVYEADGSGGDVIQIVSVHNGQFANYADWLSQMKKDLVTIHTTI